MKNNFYNKPFVWAYFILSLLLVVCGATSHAQTDTLRVLFVGNSYTFYGNMPHLIAQMAHAQKRPLIVKSSVKGGASFEDHWKGNRKLLTRQIIDKQRFDIVVLQEQSTRPITDPDSTLKYAKLLGEFIKQHGATPYFYLTWAREDAPIQQTKLTETYQKAAQQVSGKIVPIGIAWSIAREKYPNWKLYLEDLSHPTQLGAYLTAFVMYNYLTNTEPTYQGGYGTEDQNGEFVWLMTNNKTHFEGCQEILNLTKQRYQP